jgi:hypothetical protein
MRHVLPVLPRALSVAGVAAAAAVALCALGAMGAVGCHRKVGKDDCTRMLDRYLDMVIQADPATKSLPEGQAAAVREMKRAVKKADRSYAQVETQCETEVSRDEYDCAMKANIPDEWEACIE